ncbi:MAG: hypothetical protein JKY65_24975 [Planctomycetes bacterium]|nr:hypothetical protein [Planctomycetota bacterium]
MSEVQLVERQCGQCQACCRLFEITELDKPERQTCAHQCKRGCAIYTERPQRCASYRCRWLAGDPSLERRDRPDRLGVIFDKHSALGELLADLDYVVAHEVQPGAFKTKRAARWIKALGQDRIVVQVSFSGKRRVTGPPALVAELDRRSAQER